MPIVRTVIILLSGLMLASCSLPYYTQSVYGHLRLMSKREPIAEIVADPDTDPELRAQLELVMEIRGFAVDQLALPDNGSYTKYAQLDGEYPVWNVFAAEEFSVDPVTWCFPFTGCVAYRGYFSESRARGYADRLIERNAYDVWVGGAIAYSTLGHFKDPVLSSMLRYQDPWLAGLIFHEFAHQRLYVKGDSGFNEAFASVVGEIGMERWLASREG